MAKAARRRSLEIGPEDRLEALVHALGNNRVADLLDVNRSQPSRWRSGQEGMSPESLRRLTDLDYVWQRLSQLYVADVARIWLGSHNHYLGARPADVLKLRGAADVIRAIDAAEEGIVL